MDHSSNFESKNTSYQRLRTSASLEGAKGVTGTKNKQENQGHGDQDQPTREAATIIPHFQEDTDLGLICSAFRRLQLKELDRVFQRTQFPEVFVRQELGRPARGESEAESVEHSKPEDGMPK